MSRGSEQRGGLTNETREGIVGIGQLTATRHDGRSQRRTREACALTALGVVLGLVFPLLAFAHLPQITYAQGRAGAGGNFQTGGFNHRDYNQVWHQSGETWGVVYELTDGSAAGYIVNPDNPTRWGGQIGYARAQCENWNDDSGVLWTCQSTG